MVQFGKYEGNANLSDLGTLKSIVGKGGTVKFSNKNFNNPNKRVVVIGAKKDGTSAVIACSDTVSRHLRTAKGKGATTVQMLGWLVGLSVLENENEQYFISMPAGELAEGLNVDTLKSADIAEFLPEETIA